MGRKKQQKVTVININKHGEVFDPSTYVVKRADNPDLYRFLESIEIKK